MADISLAIGIVGVLFGAAGWITYYLQRRKNRNDELIRALIDLHQAIGGWIDGVAEASELADSREETALRLRKFDEKRDGFVAKVNLALLDVPDDRRFTQLREGLARFHDDVFDAKVGLMDELSLSIWDSEIAEDWSERRDLLLQSLRWECDELQRVLEAGIAQTRSGKSLR